jgi:hypothetical protein
MVGAARYFIPSEHPARYQGEVRSTPESGHSVTAH